jgi:molybdopterin-guanine dinucleotide biosynthesis protein B
MVPIVSIVGRSGSGKTTLLEKIIREFASRGITVGVVKHDAHGFEIDHEGKDSWRHKKAGAVTVALSSPDKFAIIKDVDAEWPPERIISSFLTDVDLVLTEGFKGSPFPRIEVLRKAVSTRLVSEDNALLLAVASDFEIESPRPVYALDDFKGISQLIEDKVLKGHTNSTVSLVVDGRTVDLKPFIEDLIREAVLGMIKSLKGCSGADEVELKVKRK